MNIKKYTTPVIGFILCCNTALAQQWTAEPMYSGRETNSAAILSPAHIVVAGGNEYNDSIESAFISNNYGITWTICPIGNIPSGLSSWIKSIAFADTSNGYGAGFNGKMIYTSDGGADWSFGASPIDRNFNKVVYASRTTLFIAGGWQTGDLVQPDSAQTILKSTDGGNTWNVVYDSSGPWLTSVYFTDTLHGVAVGAIGTVLITSNGGSSWSRVSVPIHRDFNAVTFVNPDTGYIAGGKQSGDSIRTIMQTTDGGSSWNVIKDEPGAWLTDISFLNSQTGNIAGENATLLHSSDGGQTWAFETVNGATGTERFSCVQFYDSVLGLIGTLNGEVFVYTNAPPPVGFTLGAEPADSTASLSASVNTGGFPGYVTFVYSTDSFFSSYLISPGQNITCDSLNIINQNISGLIPNTTYYFFVNVQNPAGSVNGDTLSFFTGTLYSVLQTTAASHITSAAAQLNGQLDHATSAFNLSFEYGTTPSFGSVVTATPASVSDTSLHAVSAGISGLAGGTTYYFRLKGVSGSSIFYGNTLAFYTGSVYKVLEALPPTSVTGTSATLNGLVDSFLLPVSLNFDYGTSAAFGSSLPANPFGVSDSFSHAVSGNLNGLQSNTLYYARLEGQTAVGTFYSDTVLFYTSQADTTFQTLAASGLTSASAQLNGLVQHFATTVNLHFQYGTSLLFGSQVTPGMSTVSDTGIHFVNAVINALQPNTTYYFRLTGTAGGNNYYGNAYSFYTGAPYPVIQTLQPANRQGTTVQLNGSWSGINAAANVSFDYGATTELNNHSYVFQFPADTALQQYSVTVGGLARGQLYFCRFKVETANGTYYGDALAFYADSTLSGIQTLTASAIGQGSAQLNGEIDSVNIPLGLSFEYGATPSFGSTVTATPDTISDSLQHYISAAIGGLQANTTYYYRLKATSAGAFFYANTRSFYTGPPEIPNWDFQLWQADTTLLPQGWTFFGGQFEQGPPHSGNYALKIEGQTIAILGVIGDNGAFGGQDFNVRPDSVICWLMYNIAPGDTAGVGVFLRKDTNIIAYNINPVSGNSGGLYQRLSFPVQYNSSIIPDSLVLAFVPTNLNGTQNNPGNYMVVDDISFTPVSPPVYNGDFETWFNFPCNQLLDWSYPNYILIDSADIPGSQTVVQSYFNPPSDFAAELCTRQAPPPFINTFMSASISTAPVATPLVKYGPCFPVTSAHQTLNGYYKFLPVQHDTMSIEIDMWKNGQNIGSGSFKASDSAAQFTPFEIPISYNNGNSQVPDSGSISIASGTQHNHGLTRLFVDKLSFDGFISGTQEENASIYFDEDGIKAYPNPTTGKLTVEVMQPSASEGVLQLFDLNGQVVTEARLAPLQNKAAMDLEDKSPGMYILRITTGDKTFNRKIIVTR